MNKRKLIAVGVALLVAGFIIGKLTVPKDSVTICDTKPIYGTGETTQTCY